MWWIIIILLTIIGKRILFKYYHKDLYYLFLKYISTPLSYYQGKHFINNFETIIKPYFTGDVTRRNIKININKEVKNEYSLLDKELTKGILEGLKEKHPKKEVLNTLLERVMDYIHLNNENINIDDLIYIDVLTAKGNYFPFFHTDIQWETFKENHGFQIWVLLNEDEEIRPRGNMFIMETDDVKKATIIEVKKNGIEMLDNGSGYLFPTILNKYNTLRDINPNIKYLNAKVGEVFIMNSLVYHCSDPQIVYSNRRALNIRIVHKPKRELKLCSPNNNYTQLLINKYDITSKDGNYLFSDDNNQMKYKFL